MNKVMAFVELEEKVEQLVNRYAQLKDENSALRRQVSFLRQENQKLKDEQREVENKVALILQRVEVQYDESDELPVANEHPDDVNYESEATRYGKGSKN